MSYQDLQHIEDKHSAVIVTVVLRVLDDMTVYVFINGEKLPDSAFRWALSHSNGKLKYWSQLDNILSRYFTGVAYLSRVTTSKMISKSSPKKRQPARGWNAAEICTNCVYTFPAQRWGPDSDFWASRPLLPIAWLALLITKAGDFESNPGSTTHTNKHTPVNWICNLCHKQIHKKQTSIRCNHTHNTHWVHLKCTQIKQGQYKPDWRCTIHTHTHTHET